MKKIAVLTSGGDAPGMNAAVRAVTKYGMANGMEVYGIRRGYKGMLEGDIFLLTTQDVSGIIDRGGTVLLTARLPEFAQPEIREKAAKNLKDLGIEGLVVIGGDGSFHGADLLYKEHGIKVIGVPGTIDNDIAGTDYTIGYDTALNIIVDAVSKLRDTATSHDRTVLVEVMGRNAGFLALYSSIASGGGGVMIPEVETSIDDLANIIKERARLGKTHNIIIIAEGVGKSTDIAEELKKKVDTSIRVTILGHIQRGGAPSALDRIIATKLGVASVDLLQEGKSGIMVGVKGEEVVTHPISYAWEEKNKLDEEDYKMSMKLTM